MVWLRDVSGGYHFCMSAFPTAALPNFQHASSCQILKLALQFCKLSAVKPQIQGS